MKTITNTALNAMINSLESTKARLVAALDRSSDSVEMQIAVHRLDELAGCEIADMLKDYPHNYVRMPTA